MFFIQDYILPGQMTQNHEYVIDKFQKYKIGFFNIDVKILNFKYIYDHIT